MSQYIKKEDVQTLRNKVINRWWPNDTDATRLAELSLLSEIMKEFKSRWDWWIPVTERLPENEKYVLWTYINSYQKSRVIRCFYTRKFQTEITENLDDDYWDYCEEKDAVFYPEWWYESNETDETYYEPDWQITHWQPLPLPPNK